MAKYKFNSGGQARNAPIVIKQVKAKKKDRKKGTTGGKIVLGLVTFFNLLMTLAIWVMNRMDILHAVESDEGVKVILTKEKKTESEKR